jgi:hypothetical protein
MALGDEGLTTLTDRRKTMQLVDLLRLDLDRDIALPRSLRMLNQPPGRSLLNTKRCTIMDREHVALAYFIMGDHTSAREHGILLVEAVKDYLFGEWRDTYTEKRSIQDDRTPNGRRQIDLLLGTEGCRREKKWMEQYCAGLVWALFLGLRDDVARLSQYPAMDCTDETELDMGRGDADKRYYILLSSVLRDGPVSSLDPGHVATIEGGRRKRPKLLLAALSRIVDGDADGFGECLHKLIKYHVKHVLPMPGLSNKLDLDASILYHAALLRGFTINNKQDDLMYLLRG